WKMLQPLQLLLIPLLTRFTHAYSQRWSFDGVGIEMAASRSTDSKNCDIQSELFDLFVSVKWDPGSLVQFFCRLITGGFELSKAAEPSRA
ncbi:MAG: hypothetical protein ACN6O2_04550, partial [Stenotrophomonas sp.]